MNFWARRPAQVFIIQVVKLDEIGDMVTALHVFKKLHELYPDATIHLQAKSFNHILFKYMPYVRPSTDWESKKPDLIIDLRGNFNSLLKALSYWPTYRLDRRTVRFRNKYSGGQKNELHTNWQIIQPLFLKMQELLPHSIPNSSTEEEFINAFLIEKNIKKFVIMHLGARDASRRWPIERYQKIMNHLNAYSYHVLLVGGPADVEINAQALKGMNSMNSSVAGDLDLIQFSTLCSKASLFVGNESGPLHIASANAIPVVALFGPGVKDVFYPLGNQVKIHHYFKEHGHKKQTAENSTIFKITVEEVISSVDQLLKLA